MINNNDAEYLFQRSTGGVKRFWELYHYLCSSGYQVDIYCGCTAEELKEHNIIGSCLNLEQRSRGIFSVPSLSIYLNNRASFKSIKKANYDCVISFDVPTTTPICLVGIRNINYFIRQNLIAYRKIQYAARKMSKLSAAIRLSIGWAMEGICIARSKRIISQCQVDIDAIKGRHPFLRRKIARCSRIQINNINPSWVCSEAHSEDCQKKYDIGYVGNFDDERKGHSLLLEALDILHERGKYYVAIFIGGGNGLQKYQERYAHLPNVSFTGHVSDPIGEIRAMRLMVVPSQSDSCPNTIMEALYNGVAVIGAKSGGIPEILTNADWLFELDANILADKIADLLENDKIADLLSQQRSRAAELSFDWGKAIEQQLAFK